MGLAEKRAVKDFQDQKFPILLKEIEAFVSCPVDIDWESIGKAEGMDAPYRGEAFEKVYFQSIIEGFKKIGSDDMGKEAIKTCIKKIELSNKSDNFGTSAISLEGGVLKIDHQPFTNVDDVSDRASKIADLISDAA
jgi:hypothetical protein